MSWITDLAELERASEPAVLVTVLASRGSAPREAGCKMVVSGADLFGTIGGGRLEHAAVGMARGMLAGADGPITRDFPLGPALGQCCGGHVTLLFEPVRPPAWEVALFGAGHVGRAVAALLGTLECRLAWIDSRPDAFPPQGNGRVRTDPASEVAGLPAGGFALVMTHDHQLDYAIVSAALRRGDLGFVGLIGSETKRARFTSRLVRDGIDDAALVCPIGLPGLGGKRPAEIAISVVAQMMQIFPSPLEGGAGGGVKLRAHRQTQSFTPHPDPLPQGEREKTCSLNAKGCACP